jgi:hypothetical protein
MEAKQIQANRNKRRGGPGWSSASPAPGRYTVKRILFILVVASVLVLRTASVEAALSATEWKKASAFLKKCAARKVEKSYREAVDRVASDDSLRAAKLLSKVLLKVKGRTLYDVTVDALAHMQNREAVIFMEKNATRQKSGLLRYLFTDVLARRKDKAHWTTLTRCAEDTDLPVALVAVRALSRGEPKKAIEALIDVLQKVERDVKRRRVKERIIHHLSELTGERFDVAIDWRNWWQARKDAFDPSDAGGSGKGGKRGGDEEDRGEEGRDEPRVMERLRRTRVRDYRKIREIRKQDIIVVEGEYDCLQDVLDMLGIRYTLVSRKAFPTVKVNPDQILFFNCHPPTDRFPRETIERIRRFVHEGGYLFTEDWDLKNVIERCFPKYLTKSKETQEKDFQVPINPTTFGRNHPLLKDCFPLNPFYVDEMQWRIDGECYTWKHDPRRVRVLVESEELYRRYGSRAVVVTFRYGSGRVLHSISHWQNQKSDRESDIALQQLLLNFISAKYR